MSKYKPKTKTHFDNYRLEVTVPDPTRDIYLFGDSKKDETPEEKNHRRWECVLNNMANNILRHCDVENVQIKWDSGEVCVYCDEPFDSAFDPMSGEPACCEKAVNDFEAYQKELEDKP